MIIKCKMCGGDIEFTPGATYGTCEYCGSTCTIPQADDEQKLNRYNRANHFRRQCEFDKALAAYEKILEQDDTDAEAHWGAALSRYGIEYVEDPATKKRIPTCHRLQVASILADVDYLAAVEHAPDETSRELYKQQAAEIAEIQKGILAISANEKTYDVFICYKEMDADGQRTHDSQWAQDIYYGLTEHGYKVFFSRITLEDKLGQQYEPYIFAALNSAKVMVVVGSKPEYFNAVWVKNEWSRYLALMKTDHTRLLIPCYRDMDPYDLPEELSILQSQNMSKIGFMQDLLRGVKKVLDAGQKAAAPVPVAASVTVPVQAANANATALVKRGYMALADKEWNAADHFFDEALNMDAELSDAYLGRFLAAKGASSLDDYANTLWQKLQQFDVKVETILQTEAEQKHINEQIHAYASALDSTSVWKFYQVERIYQKTIYTAEESVKSAQHDRNLQRAIQFAIPQKQQEIQQIFEKAQQIMKDCQTQCQLKNVQELATAQARIQKDFSAADAKVQQAFEQAKAEKEHQKQLEAVRRKQQKILAEAMAIKAARKKRTFMIVVAVVFAAAVLIPVLTQVIIPRINYSIAERLRNSGQYEYAVSVFTGLRNYSDARKQIYVTYYAEGEAKRDAADWAGAIEAFTNAEDYSDARRQIYVTYYAEGEAKRDAADWAGAIEAFTNAGDYEDSMEQLTEAKYQMAKSLMDAKDYIGAATIFITISDYKDVKTLLAKDDKMIEATVEARFAVGNYVTFGSYTQTASGDDMTEIEWLVLARDGKKALLISRYGLDVQKYHSEERKITWRNCSLRRWLNSTFLNKAFTATEQSAILMTIVDNSNDQGYYSTDGGDNTQDKVFLLSYAEANKYLAITDDGYNEALDIEATAYAKERGAYIVGKTTYWCCWWLRSPGEVNSEATCVRPGGNIGSHYVSHPSNAVRPALWVNLESGIF